jgi:hypothetical protein
LLKIRTGKKKLPTSTSNLVVSAIKLLDTKTIDIRKMFEKLIGVEERFIDIENHLADPEIVQDRDAYKKYVREHAELNKIVTVFRRYKQTMNDL